MTNDVGGTRKPEIRTQASPPPLDLARRNSGQDRGDRDPSRATRGYGDDPPPPYTDGGSQERSQVDRILGRFKRTFQEEIAGVKSSPVDDMIKDGGGWRLDVELWRLGGVGGRWSTGGILGAEWGYAKEKNDHQKQWGLEGRMGWGILSHGKLHRHRWSDQDGEHRRNVHEGGILLGLAHGKWERTERPDRRENGGRDSSKKWNGVLGWGLAYAETDLHRWSREDGTSGHQSMQKYGTKFLARLKMDKRKWSDTGGNEHVKSEKEVGVLGFAQNVEKTKVYNQQGNRIDKQKVVVLKAFGGSFVVKREGGERPFESRYNKNRSGLTGLPSSSEGGRRTVVEGPSQPQGETSQPQGDVIEESRR